MQAGINVAKSMVERIGNDGVYKEEVGGKAWTLVCLVRFGIH